MECDEAIEGLEKIDDETDALDITMVKVNDARYAKKYGVNKMPALVSPMSLSLSHGETMNSARCTSDGSSPVFTGTTCSMRTQSWNG